MLELRGPLQTNEMAIPSKFNQITRTTALGQQRRGVKEFDNGMLE